MHQADPSHPPPVRFLASWLLRLHTYFLGLSLSSMRSACFSVVRLCLQSLWWLLWDLPHVFETCNAIFQPGQRTLFHREEPTLDGRVVNPFTEYLAASHDEP